MPQLTRLMILLVVLVAHALAARFLPNLVQKGEARDSPPTASKPPPVRS